MTDTTNPNAPPVDAVRLEQLRIAADHFHRFTAALVRAGYPNELSSAATAEMIEAALAVIDPEDDDVADAATSIDAALYAMRWQLDLLPMDNGTNPL